MPFFLFAGVAAQAGGFYLSMVLIPLAVYWRKGFPIDFVKPMRLLSLSFFVLWAIFPLSNLINYAQQDLITLSWKSILTSHFSSSLLLCSLALLLFSLRGQGVQHFTAAERSPTLKINLFLKGLLFFSLIEGAYILCQQFLGIDYRGDALLDSEKIMASGIYRALGFYSHPLSLAAVSLTYFSWLSFLWGRESEGLPSRRIMLALLILHAYFIVASGGRFAILVALAITFFTLKRERGGWGGEGTVAPPGRLPLGKLFLIGLTLIGGSLLLLVTGIGERFTRLLTLANAQETDRLTFWKVHWQIFLDKPWWGHGEALLDAYVRKLYYVELGLQTMERKYAAHNFYLEILTNVGVFGSLIIVGASYLGWRALKKIASLTQQQTYLGALAFSFLGNLINGLTQNVFFDSTAVFIYLALIFMMIVPFHRAKHETS